MKKELVKEDGKPADDIVVIADECGDTLWDAVLEQDDKLMKRSFKSGVPLFSNVNTAQECDATEAK